MELLYSTSLSPYTNLALEHHLATARHAPVALVWRSQSAVVIGRNQNPWQEINHQYIRRHNIALVRRESGGGAVYHDLGNINFCFIGDQHRMTPQHNLTLIVRALHRIGVQARITSHHDITVGGKKISGSAFRITRGHRLHHGSLLIDANLRHLRAALQPTGIVRESAAIPSRRASVMNINSAIRGNREQIIGAFLDALLACYRIDSNNEQLTVRYCDPSDVVDNKLLAAQSAILCSADWLYGRAPPFQIQCRIGRHTTMDISLRAGIIDAVRISSPTLRHTNISSILNAYTGIYMTADALASINPPIRHLPSRKRLLIRRIITHLTRLAAP